MILQKDLVSAFCHLSSKLEDINQDLIKVSALLMLSYSSYEGIPVGDDTEGKEIS